MAGYPAAFSQAIEFVLANEGGYTNNPDDPGGETRWGISKRFLDDAGLNVDPKVLTRDDAIDIYYEEFWQKAPYDQIHNTLISTKLLDIHVNTGLRQAAKIIQRACRACGRAVDDDGVIGGKTMEAINLCEPVRLLVGMKSEQAGFYRILVAEKPNMAVFLHGFLNRAYS